MSRSWCLASYESTIDALLMMMKMRIYRLEGLLTSSLACLMLVFAIGLQGCAGRQAKEPSTGGGKESSDTIPDKGRLDSPADSACSENCETRKGTSLQEGLAPASACPYSSGFSYPGFHNAWGGSSSSALDMELFGPGGTVVFRNPSFPLGDVPMRKQESPSSFSDRGSLQNEQDRQGH